MLSPVEIQLLIITIITFALILWNRLPIEIVALLLLVVLGLSELVAPDRVLSGFSSTVVITLLGLFVITRALEQTGVIQSLAERLNRIGKGSETRLITVFMLAGAGMSLVMNNVAAGAVLLPAVVQVARISKVKVSKLLIPMSFGTLLGGMATYLTTANIVMSTLLIDNDLQGLNMMDFIPVGSLIVAAGVLYMLVIGRHLLPDRESITQSTFPDNLQETYQLDERTWEVRIMADSPLINQPLSASGIGEELGLTVLAIWRGHHAMFTPASDEIIRLDDYLLVLGRQERVDILLTWGTQLRNGTHMDGTANFNRHVNLTEVIIPPRSEAIGQTLTQLQFRDQFGVTAVAIWREGRSFRTDVGKMELRVGDALLIVGYAERIKKMAAHPGYLVPAAAQYSEAVRPQKALIAMAITAVVLLLAIFELFPIPQLMLAGAVGMVLTGCLTIEEFYDSIEWKVIFVIAGILPLSIALTDSGLAGRAGTAIVDLLSGYPPIVVIMGMFALTVFITQVMGGQVSALLIGPVAISTALQINISPQAMSVAVAIACSTAFLTPIAHPVNLLMMGPGGYQFNDFLKVGIGMTIVTLLSLAGGLMLIWQL
ncbi:MAG: SLC13 family permease [Anaerolineae bacterium]